MRILQVGPVPKKVGGTTTGGVATHVWELSTSLVSRGHDVAIVADNMSLRDRTHKSVNGVDIHSPSITSIATSASNILYLSRGIPEFFRLTEDFSITNRMKMLIHSSFLKTVFDTFSPDLIHSHHLYFRYPMANLVAEKTFPTVTTAHSFHSTRHGENQVSNRSVYQKNLEHCENVIYVSSKVKEKAKEITEQAPEFERVIFNAVNTRKFGNDVDVTTVDRQTGGHQKVLYVGNLLERKGILDFLDCIDTNFKNDSNLDFVIVGDGPLRSQIEDFVEKKGINNVEIKGRVSEDRLIREYKNSNLFVLPSYDESFGIVFIEAQSCGLPVIGTTRVPPEVVSPPVCGIRITPGSIDELNEAIRVGLEKDWSNEAIRAHAEEFDWESKTDEYIETYREVYARSKDIQDFRAGSSLLPFRF